MSVRNLNFAEPFFTVKYIVGEKSFDIQRKKNIIFNLSRKDIMLRSLPLGYFKSTVVVNIEARELDRCLLIEDFDRHADQERLFQEIKAAWTLVFEATGQPRHKGVQLWRSPKERVGNAEVNMCYADAIPLRVGLHQTHWGEAPFREVHTQVVGVGKMQQYYEKDENTLYREDYLAPGCTHQPMYDENCAYPWHQYETVTRGIFMATEMQLGDEPISG